MKRSTLLVSALVLAIAWPSVAMADDPASFAIHGPAGTYQVVAPGPVTIEYLANAIVIRWGDVPTPIPPAPDPIPTPTPTPTPDPPAPFPSPDGLRVLMVYETNDLASYPPDQKNVMYDKTFRDYLTKTCVEWRVYDKDTDISSGSEPIKTAMTLPRESLPWIVISNGKTGYSGPIPGNADLAQKLVAKYEVTK